MAQFQGSIIRNLLHDALDQRGFTLTVLAHKGHLLASFDRQINIFQDDIVAIPLRQVLRLDGDGAGMWRRREFQVQGGVILLIHLDDIQFLQLLDARLHLVGLGSLVAETLDEVFRVLYLLLLVLVSPQLLLAALLAQLHVLGIGDLVIVYLA